MINWLLTHYLITVLYNALFETLFRICLYYLSCAPSTINFNRLVVYDINKYIYISYSFLWIYFFYFNYLWIVFFCIGFAIIYKHLCFTCKKTKIVIKLIIMIINKYSARLFISLVIIDSLDIRLYLTFDWFY